MRVITAAAIAAAYSARYPNAGAGVVDSIEAGAGKAKNIDAAAVKGFAEVSGKLQWVKAVNGHFLHAGETIREGDYVQLQANVAQRLIANNQAEPATDAEVQAAQDEADAAPKGKK
jgi:hypothetical protein